LAGFIPKLFDLGNFRAPIKKKPLEIKRLNIDFEQTLALG
jgi:hypothetical protein